MDVSWEAEGNAWCGHTGGVVRERWQCPVLSAGACILEAKQIREYMELGNVFGLGVSQYYVLGMV